MAYWLCHSNLGLGLVFSKPKVLCDEILSGYPRKIISIRTSQLTKKPMSISQIKIRLCLRKAEGTLIPGLQFHSSLHTRIKVPSAMHKHKGFFNSTNTHKFFLVNWGVIIDIFFFGNLTIFHHKVLQARRKPNLNLIQSGTTNMPQQNTFFITWSLDHFSP